MSRIRFAHAIRIATNCTSWRGQTNTIRTHLLIRSHTRAHTFFYA
nr:MAG TPA: hypothetical protein [Herelleviridae sp.]